MLDVRARTVDDAMTVAAAHEIARFAEEDGLEETHILPTMAACRLHPRVAAVTGVAAQERGLARLVLGREALHERATRTIEQARAGLRILMAEGVIAAEG